jgi:hypothetical protein
MQKPFELFKGTTGVNNKVDPSRIEDTDLANAYNVDIDDSGRVSRRKNFVTAGITTNCNSLYSNGERGLYLVADSMYLLFPDLTARLIATGIVQNLKMRCVSVNGVIYWVNGQQIGKVDNDVAGSWIGEAYVGPTTYRRFSNPPIGHLVAYHAGRIWIAADNVLWFSEPFAFSWFDLAKNMFQFNSRLRMIISVEDGLYISTENCAYFLKGTDPGEIVQNKVHDYPSIEGTDLNAPGGQVLAGEYTGQVAMWTSTRSICIGMPGGRVSEVTEKKLTYPEGTFGSAAFLNNTYYCLINE